MADDKEPCPFCGSEWLVTVDSGKHVCSSCGEVWTLEKKRPKEYDLLAVEVQGAE
ncbi:MAG TPA: hypothetical protein VGK23_07305 [Methanomassiliicoccales archaeon]|jgi:predicted nucleic acid-binding Zn ribbon protein